MEIVKSTAKKYFTIIVGKLIMKCIKITEILQIIMKILWMHFPFMVIMKLYNCSAIMFYIITFLSNKNDS